MRFVGTCSCPKMIEAEHEKWPRQTYRIVVQHKIFKHFMKTVTNNVWLQTV